MCEYPADTSECVEYPLDKDKSGYIEYVAEGDEYSSIVENPADTVE